MDKKQIETLLKDAGITEDKLKPVLDAVMSENDKDIKAEQAKTEVKEGELTKANETITGLRDTVKKYDGKDPEKLQEDLGKLQKKYDEDTKTIKSDYENKLKDMAINTAIEKALTSSNAKHSDLLTTKFDREKIVFKDGTVTGVDEQLKGIKDNYKDLFEEKVSGTTPANPDTTPGGMTYESIVANVDNMSAEEVAAKFAALNSK